MTFIRGSNPIWIFRDLVGLPLNDEYYISFLSNIFPYVPSLVYRSSVVIPPAVTPDPWPDPVQLLANGALPDNIYFQDDLTYRLEVRRGPLQSDELIYVVNDYIPGSTSGGNGTASGSQSNQITNGQFSEISFGLDGSAVTPSTIPTLNITASGTYEIAPGWELVLTGSGTAKVEQFIMSGVEIPPIPAYYMQFSLTGWSSAKLIQRLYGNGGIWANDYVYLSMLAKSNDGVKRNISMSYVPSDPPGAGTVIAADTLTPGTFTTIKGVFKIPQSANTQLNDVAYVDIVITLDPNGIVDLTDVYMIAQISNELLTAADFAPQAEETIEREQDHFFHLYRDELILKPKTNLLTGWTFATNPAQFRSKTLATVVTQTNYIFDQTILHQESGSSVMAGIGSVSINAPLQIKAINTKTANRVAIIQYIDPATILPFWASNLSALVHAKISSSHDTKCRIKMRLIYRSTTLPPVLSASEPISSWPANSDPVFSAGWTAIAPENDPSYILENTATASYPDLSFNKFTLPPNDLGNMTLGVVVYTMDNINETSTSEDSIFIERVSLTEGNFASDISPETYDESLRKCQYYYESSYSNGVLPGTITDTGKKIAQNGPSYIAIDDTNGHFYAKSFYLPYKEVKRAVSTLILYSPDTGATSEVSIAIMRDGIPAIGPVDRAESFWNQIGSATDGVCLISNATSDLLLTSAGNAPGDEGIISYHYTADARLGV